MPMPSTPNDPLSLSVTTDLLAAKAELSRRYLAGPREGLRGAALFSAAVTPEPGRNLLGIGVGEKVTEAGPTGAPALKLFVRAKLPPSQVSSENLLPATVDGLPTDVEEVGQIV